MSNSPLATEVFLVPSTLYGSRKGCKINKITVHHQAGHLTAKQCYSAWVNRYSSKGQAASANYSICDGVIGLLVEEKDRAYTSSSGENDKQSVTIEVANVRGATYNSNADFDWCVSERDFEMLIRLCVDICHRNGFRLNWTGDKNGTLTIHQFFASTHCPGNFLKSRMPHLALEVNRRLDELEDENMTQETFNKLMDGWIAERSSRGCSTWAQSVWLDATERGLVDGTRPLAFCTRQEMAQMFANERRKGNE